MSSPRASYVDPLETRDPMLFEDVSKKCFRLPKVYLTCIIMWPTKIYSRSKDLAFSINLFLMVTLELCQLIYLATNSTDVKQFTIVMSTLSTALQGIAKTALLWTHSHRLRVILDEAFFTFWPSNLLGRTMNADLKFTSNFVQFNMICVSVSATAFGIGFSLKPLFDGNRELPFATWLPFDWKAPIVYECIYLIQTFTNLVLIIPSALGHDFIFVSLAANVIAQLRLMGYVTGRVGSGNDQEFDALLAPIEGIESKQRSSYEKQLLVKIIAHHHRVLFICQEMEDIFSPTLFVQLATSLVAICVSSFLITAVAEIEMGLLYQLTPYCLGHVLQLFIICAAGSEMAYQSQAFCENAYACFWYNQKFSDIRRALLLVILRAQRAVRVTALGVFEMDYTTFISVMRLSFSFYTLLTMIMEKS